MFGLVWFRLCCLVVFCVLGLFVLFVVVELLCGVVWLRVGVGCCVVV